MVTTLSKLPGESCWYYIYRNINILGVKNCMVLFIAISCIVKVTINCKKKEIKKVLFIKNSYMEKN